MQRSSFRHTATNCAEDDGSLFQQLQKDCLHWTAWRLSVPRRLASAMSREP